MVKVWLIQGNLNCSVKFREALWSLFTERNTSIMYDMIRFDSLQLSSSTELSPINIVNEIMCDSPSNLVLQRCKLI